MSEKIKWRKWRGLIASLFLLSLVGGTGWGTYTTAQGKIQIDFELRNAILINKFG